jgi:hypothetical protein
MQPSMDRDVKTYLLLIYIDVVMITMATCPSVGRKTTSMGYNGVDPVLGTSTLAYIAIARLWFT